MEYSCCTNYRFRRSQQGGKVLAFHCSPIRYLGFYRCSLSSEMLAQLEMCCDMCCDMCKPLHAFATVTMQDGNLQSQWLLFRSRAVQKRRQPRPLFTGSSANDGLEGVNTPIGRHTPDTCLLAERLDFVGTGILIPSNI
jgi:hypothetical protein